MKKVLLCSSGILLLFFISVNAQASLYEQLPYSTAGALNSSTPFQVYDDFILPTSASINTITWWGFHYGTNPQFTYTIYSDNANSPGSVYYTASGSPNLGSYTTTDGQVIDQYSINLGTTFTVSTGTTYWLSIYNTDTNSLWGWDIAEYGNGSIEARAGYDKKGNLVYYDAGGDILDPFAPGGTSNVAFKLENVTVPIPPAAWLLASGLIGLVLIRRRRRMR